MNHPYQGSILIVDDEVEILDALRDFFAEIGYETERCTSGGVALEVLKKRSFDLLITDLMMPGMSGIEVLHAAFSIDPQLIGIIITGKGSIQTAVDAMKSGAFDYLLKPLEWKLLKPVIDRAMEVGRVRRSEKKYRAIVEDQTELICRFLPDGTLTFVNEVYCRYFDKKPEKLLGRSFVPLVVEEDRSAIFGRLRSLTPENPVINCEHRVRAPDGGIRWQRWTNRAMFNKEGMIIQLQSVGRDVTDRKTAEMNLRRAYEQVRALAAQLNEVEEKERKELVRELHDQVGQNLTALGINLKMILSEIDGKENDTIRPRLEDSLMLLEQTTERIRSLMSNLRPSLMDDYGLMAVIRWFGGEFATRTGISVTVQGEELDPRLDQNVETTLFRIVQEALNNVAKHAGAQNVTITLADKTRQVELAVADDGRGFDTERMYLSPEQPGWGIISMRERAEAIGGVFRVQTAPGKGTKVIVEVKR